jgi:hypothetical protein
MLDGSIRLVWYDSQHGCESVGGGFLTLCNRELTTPRAALRFLQSSEGQG